MATKKQIVAYLNAKGFKHALQGFELTIRAIEIGIEDKETITKGIFKGLYQILAKEKNITISQLERNIRHSIKTSEYAINRLNMGLSNVSNAEFLAKAVDDVSYGL